jgi:hypothetical protein
MTGRTTTLRSAATLALAIGVFAMIGASECAKVESSVTGPEETSEFLPSPGNDPCVRECWIAAMDAREEEIRRHLDALRECGEDRECIREENQVHEVNLHAIKDEFFECREACHEQGGGSGGQ